MPKLDTTWMKDPVSSIKGEPLIPKGEPMKMTEEEKEWREGWVDPLRLRVETTT